MSVERRILDTACQLFYEEGLHAVGIDRLLVAAGAAKASLDSHYASKDELVAAYLDALGRGWRARVEERVAPTDGRAGLRALFALVEEWVRSKTFRGCPFLNAVSELPDPAHPGREAVRRHRERAARPRPRAGGVGRHSRRRARQPGARGSVRRRDRLGAAGRRPGRGRGGESCREPTARRTAPLEVRAQEAERLLPSLRRLLVGDVVAQELPALRVAGLGVDGLELAVDDVEPGDRRERVAQPGEAEVRARRDERVDVGRGEVLEQARARSRRCRGPSGPSPRSACGTR